MATLEVNDSNIIDAEAINLRLIVYPVLVVLLLVVGGFGCYYYQLNQREELESRAREAMVAAKTPEALLKVADDFPGTDQGTMAVLAAAQLSLAKPDYDAALKDYQRVLSETDKRPLLHDAAQLGIAYTLDATGKFDDAVNDYLEVARQGDKSPYSPYAYHAAAGIYEQRGDKDKERNVLIEASGLTLESPFVKEAQDKLKQLNPASQSPMINLGGTPANAAPAAPAVPVAPTPAK